MKLNRILFVLALFSICIAPAHGANKDIVELQTQVTQLQQQMTQMKQSFDERMGIMKDLLTQQTDNINKMGNSVQNLEKTLSQQNTDSSGKVDQLSGQVQALHDSVDELKARLLKTAKQLDDLQAALQNLNTQPAAPPGTSPANPQSQAPPPDVLYNSALGDFNSGKNDLAGQEFVQYLQAYGNTDRAGNAQFYVGEIDYRRGNFQAAVADYNKVLDQYPGGNKEAAARLKKGYALLELGQRDAGVKELQALITRYPKSPEASQAKSRLNQLGVAGAASGRTRPSPRHL